MLQYIHHILTLNVLSELPFTLLVCFFPWKNISDLHGRPMTTPSYLMSSVFFLFAFVWWNLRRFLRTRMLASPIWHFTSWRISPWKCFSSPLHPLLEKPWIDGCNEWNRENLWDNQWACKCWSMVRCKSYFRPFWGLGFGKLWRRKWAKGVIAE